MEELGFTIAVPETMLCGFAIMVVLAVVIFTKVLKTARLAEETNDKVNDIEERLERIEKALERTWTKQA